MATLRAFTGLITIAVLLQAALGADHGVGGSGGWELTTDLSSWASAETFKTGDTLTFSYGAQHSIIEVTKADYDSCSSTNAINSYTDGNTVIKLSSAGKRYFICGTAGHCSGGMKMEINTVSAAVTAAPPPATLLTPSPATLLTPAPATLLTPAPSTYEAPSVAPSEAPLNAPSPNDSPTLALTPIGSGAVPPASESPGMAPPPQPSAASCHGPVIGVGLMTSVMMVLLI